MEYTDVSSMDRGAKVLSHKITIALNSSWNLVNFRLGLIQSFLLNGYEVVAVAPLDEYSSQLSKIGCRFISLPMDNKGCNIIRDSLVIFRLFRLFKSEKPDIFLGYTIKPNIYGSIVALALGVPYINNISGLGTTFMKEGWLNLFVRLLYKFALSNSSKVFFQNYEDQYTFVSGGLVKKSVVDCLPGSGIDLKKFSPVSLPEKSFVRFLLIARMLWDKGIGEFVTASRLLSQRGVDAEFCLLGFLDVQNRSAISRQQMNEWIDEGIIKYLGVSDNVSEEIAKADCVVLPSYREGTPRSLLEAAAMSRPVITANSVGCRNVVEDRITGLLVRVKDPNDLADKMETFSKFPHSYRIEMGLKGREKIEREFDEKIVIRKYLNIISTILQKKYAFICD